MEQALSNRSQRFMPEIGDVEVCGDDGEEDSTTDMFDVTGSKPLLMIMVLPSLFIISISSKFDELRGLLVVSVVSLLIFEVPVAFAIVVISVDDKLYGISVE